MLECGGDEGLRVDLRVRRCRSDLGLEKEEGKGGGVGYVSRETQGRDQKKKSPKTAGSFPKMLELVHHEMARRGHFAIRCDVISSAVISPRKIEPVTAISPCAIHEESYPIRSIILPAVSRRDHKP